MRQTAHHDESHKGEGHTFEKHEKIEGLADYAGMGFVVALGAVMVIGLLTASGNVTW